MFNLQNKKVIVTGATGGIGNAIVKLFIDSGAKVLATGTNEEKLNLLKDKYKILINKFFFMRLKDYRVFFRIK